MVEKSPFWGSGALGGGSGGPPLRPGKDGLLAWRNGGPGPGLPPSPGEGPEASDAAPGRGGEVRSQIEFLTTGQRCKRRHPVVMGKWQKFSFLLT